MNLLTRWRKRPVLLLVLLAVLLLVGSGAWLLWPRTPGHRINRESLRQIHFGMTEPEIEAVLGVPPGDYGRGRPTRDIVRARAIDEMHNPLLTTFSPEWSKAEWLDDDFGIIAILDGQDKCICVCELNVYRPRSFVQKLRSLLGL